MGALAAQTGTITVAAPTGTVFPNTGVDLFDKSSGWLADLHLPVLSQWSQLKDWATTGSGGG